MKTQVDIKLLNGSKQEVTYETVETVGMPLADGTGEQVFTAGEPLDNIPVALDFTNGDQQVEAPEGYVVRSAVIAKPEGVEQVIAKGATAAGIVGEYVTPGTTKEIELDFRDCLFIDAPEDMSALLGDRGNIGKYVKYTGETGEYVSGQFYKVVDEYEAFEPESCPATAAVNTKSTTITATLEGCKVGDLIVATFAIRSDLVSLSNGWVLISTSSQSITDINSASTSNQTLSFAYKYATSTTEELTVTQTSNALAYINMVSLGMASVVNDAIYQYQNNATAVDTANATFTRPEGKLILWGVTRSYWLNTNPGWAISNDSYLVQLDSTSAQRLLLAVDTSEDKNVTFKTGAAAQTDAYICGALSVELEPAVHLVEVDGSEVSDSDTQIVPASGDARWDEVVVKKPGTLIPENIADGVDIAGVVGAFKPPELCLFTISKNATAGRTYAGQATGSYTATASISVPLASEIKAVCAAGNSFSQTTSSYLQYPVMYALDPVTNYTETVGATSKTITWSRSATYSSSSNYGRVAVVLMVVFVVPGVTLRPAETGLIFYCDATVTAIPESQGDFPAATKITEADLHESAITSIQYAFYACSSLKKVILPDTLRTIGRQCFYNCRNLSEIAIPDGVTSISDYAFQYCVALSEIVIPSGVTNIGPSAFTGCSGLSQVTISAGVKTIGSQAFFGCTSLDQITIPNTVTSIADSAFYGCNALETVDCSSCTSVPALGGTSVFYNCPSTLQIKVPAALYDEWIAATNWSTYADKVVSV